MVNDITEPGTRNVYITLRDLVKAVKSKLSAIGKYDLEKHSDDDIAMFVDEVCQAIKNYCQIPNILYAMRYIVANICVDYILYCDEMAKEIDPDAELDLDPSDLASVKIGDVTVGLGDKYRSNLRKQTLNSHAPDLDSFLMNYTSQLNRFRRIW